MATLWIAAGLAATTLVAQTVRSPRITQTVIELANGMTMPYAIAIPRDLQEGEARPLVLALHPGGRAPYYGSRFMQRVIEPALRDWRSIMVAPDVPSRRWAEELSEQAVMALIENVMSSYAIDRSRVLVTGFSMGGRGTWYFATRHNDVFTGAIPIAGSRSNDPLDGLGAMPIHIIHSPADTVIPFGPAAESADQLQQQGHSVAFTEVVGAAHHDMGAYVEPLRQAGRWMLGKWGSVE